MIRKYKGNRKKKFLEAYQQTMGNISASCKMVGIKSRSTVYKWMNKDAKFRKRIKELDDSFIDAVETQLYKKVRDGNLNAIKFYLINKAPERWQDKGVVVNTQVFNKQGDVIIDNSDRELQEQLLGELQRRFNL